MGALLSVLLIFTGAVPECREPPRCTLIAACIRDGKAVKLDSISVQQDSVRWGNDRMLRIKNAQFILIKCPK